MNRDLVLAFCGVAVAIVVTTAMDATGLAAFSALPLFPLAAILIALQKIPARDYGLTRGTARDYGLALLYPLAVLGLVAISAWIGGAIDTSQTDWHKALLNMALMSTTGVIFGLLTEEGFFRGWLWAALRRAGLDDKRLLVVTTLAFTTWHVSAISLDTGFDVPAGEIPVYLVNATLIGGVFGLLRVASGSIVVPSVCHAAWNGIAYPFYGFGEKSGALGIENTFLYGPEVGLIGIALNLAFAVFLWKFVFGRRSEG